MQDAQITLGDGRTLAYTDIGDAAGSPVLFFHGAPLSRLHLAYLEEQFLAQGIRVLSPDRPGYGKSSPLPGRRLADWPADVEALANALAIDRFMVAGHSSGGPYAVACAALLPGRVSALIALAGVTDMGWGGAWAGFSEMESHVMRMPDEAAAIAWCAEKFGADGSGFHSASDFEFAEPDNALFADDLAGPAIGAAAAEAFRQGVAGYAQDAFVQGRAWTFDVGAIASPAHIVHGGIDAAVPLAHSRHTAQLVAGSSLRVLPGHGHMTILSELPTMASELSRGRTA
ncbi:alpha/beta fold hydrolase [Allomesorhizobium camelthorni]|uniref:Alpha/beta hydrolase n=1 Tax=Allomesorhizobium camelthorni TaxID=475069 RepID=A0A6G4WB78_9HYPH|nr:alpha/beta hydrolase [Mesorhizobium camelthorni]NGO51844.1 alpha/beta hydrolase [Mesorhizobium camelthorni]